MGGPGRPRSPLVDRAILQAALDVLGECGPSALTIEGVACRAGVGKATVYRRWDGKEDLILDALATLNQDIPEPVGDSVHKDLVTLVSATLRRMTESVDGAVFARLLGEVDQHREMVAMYHESVVRPRRARLRAVLDRGIADGTLRPDTDVEVVLHMIIGGLLHTVSMCRLHRRPIPDDLVDRLVDTALRGVTAT
ncbi:MAG: TetR/AcrR family transcriptional regulator [Actinomycetes bacterium]